MHLPKEPLTYTEFDKELTAQLDLISNLQKLVSRQEIILRDGRVDEIASLNHAKSALLLAVRPNIGTLQELHESWQTMQNKLQPWQRQRIEQKVQELRKAVEEVLQKERQSERQINQARRKMSARIEGQWNTSIARLVESA